jgi:2,3-bisphosphoglycerate-dependent phosphoglycerate mutase
LVKLAELRERDFRSWEGKPYGSRSADRSPYPDAESNEEMEARANRFIEGHIRPLFEQINTDLPPECSVVVVGHGIILNTLLRALLLRFAPSELIRFSGRGDSGRKTEYLAPWSNTGYLEAAVTRNILAEDLAFPGSRTTTTNTDPSVPYNTARGSIQPLRSSMVSLVVNMTNCLDHLKGLKKTRGGIGSARFDEKQKTMDSYLVSAPKTKKTEQEQDL